jgi:membrane fusion protein, heavy metal efflux system
MSGVQSTRRWWAVAAAVIIAIAGLVWWRSAETEPTAPDGDGAASGDVVRVAGPDLIAVQPDTPLASKLDVRTVATERIAAPLLSVTGSVVARLSPGTDNADARWDFSQLELATTYADWLRARAEEPYTQQQLAKTRELVAARVAAQTELVDRLRLLVKAGTDSPRDLAKAEADLVEAQLDGKKEIYEAETAAKTAQRTRATLARQLFQAGIDPELLSASQEGTTVLVADVPEGRIGLVRDGQAAEARFYALPGETISGRVRSLAPALTADRRTLRVFFELDDPLAHLRPGMFAEVGLGTEPRDALLVPSDAVLHVGRTDYVLVRTQPGLWRATPVQVGEAHDANVEILSGLTPGDQIVGRGAILLKPPLVQALQG